MKDTKGNDIMRESHSHIPVAGVLGQGGWTSRGEGVGTLRYPVKIQIFKKFKTLTSYPYLVTVAAEGRFIQFKFEGSGVPIARGYL